MGRGRGGRRAAPWLAAAVLLAGVGLPGSALAIHYLPSAPAIGSGHPLPITPTHLAVRVNVSNVPAFSPSTIVASPGDTLNLTLANNGSYSPTFTVSAVKNFPLPTDWTPQQLNGFFSRNGSLANVTVGPNSTVTASIPLAANLTPGNYEFVSLYPYQFQAGMSGELEVQGPPVQLNETTVNSLAFVPAILNYTPTAYPVTFSVDIQNLGSTPHTFWIASQSNVTITGNSSTYFTSHPPLSAVNIGSSSVVFANFTIPAAGIYEYVCTLHVTLGMVGFLYVGVPPPASAAPLSTAIVDAWILVGAALLLGIGVAIAILASFTGQHPPKGPPARGH